MKNPGQIGEIVSANVVGCIIVYVSGVLSDVELRAV